MGGSNTPLFTSMESYIETNLRWILVVLLDFAQEMPPPEHC